jgi:hypothetical protein
MLQQQAFKESSSAEALQTQPATSNTSFQGTDDTAAENGPEMREGGNLAMEVCNTPAAGNSDTCKALICSWSSVNVWDR